MLYGVTHLRASSHTQPTESPCAAQDEMLAVKDLDEQTGCAKPILVRLVACR